MTDRVSAEQRAALAKLASVLPDDAYLAGGVAAGAQLHHRTSRDLDLFLPSDPTVLQPTLEALAGVVIESRSAGTLHLRVDGVPTSLLQYCYPLLDAAVWMPDLPVALASITDLACMKLSAIASRGAARDFWDLHEIVVSARRDVSDLLAAYQRKFPVEDVGHVIRSVAYFGDADAAPLPTGLTREHWSLIKADFASWVPALVR